MNSDFQIVDSLQKEQKYKRIEEITKMMEGPGFWLDRHLSSSLIQEMNKLSTLL